MMNDEEKDTFELDAGDIAMEEALLEDVPYDPDYTPARMPELTSTLLLVKEEQEKKEEKPASFVSELIDFAKDFVICCVVVFVLCTYVIKPIQVRGSSMYPTLKDSSIGVSNLFGRKFGEIERFDIVIVYLAEKDEYLVKRVIGMPGETVSYVDGRLYINGEPMDEPFLDTEYAETYSDGVFMEDVDPITLGEDEYYCLGDNRPHSSDSRYYGPFTEDQITSKGVFIFYPLTQFGVKTW